MKVGCLKVNVQRCVKLRSLTLTLWGRKKFQGHDAILPLSMSLPTDQGLIISCAMF